VRIARVLCFFQLHCQLLYQVICLHYALSMDYQCTNGNWQSESICNDNTPYKAAFKFQLFHFQDKSVALSKGCVTNSVCGNILCGQRQRDAEG
jgi:hypothetical protein